MSESETYKKIVACARDVLHARRMVAEGCFATDAAATELEGYGPAALPIVEELIRSEVIPALSRGLSRHDLEAEFVGLVSLWTTYLRIAGRQHGTCATAFLRKVEIPIALTAAVAAQPVFRAVPKQWSDMEIPRELWEFFNELRTRVRGDDRALLDRIVDGFYLDAFPQSGGVV